MIVCVPDWKNSMMMIMPRIRSVSSKTTPRSPTKPARKPRGRVTEVVVLCDSNELPDRAGSAPSRSGSGDGDSRNGASIPFLSPWTADTLLRTIKDGSRVQSVDLQVQSRAEGMAHHWETHHWRDVVNNAYWHQIDRKTFVRTAVSEVWTAGLWADVLRNPYPRTPEPRLIFKNPCYSTEFEHATGLDIDAWLQEGWSVDYQKVIPPYVWAGDTRIPFKAKPDFVIRAADGEPALVVDSKWHRDITKREVIQVFGYGRMLECHGAIVIPEHSRVSASVEAFSRALGVAILRSARTDQQLVRASREFLKRRVRRKRMDQARVGG